MIRINIIQSQIQPRLRVKPGTRAKLSYCLNGLYLLRAAQRISPAKMQKKSFDGMTEAFKSGKISMIHLLSLDPETAGDIINRLTNEELIKTLEHGTSRIKQIKQEMTDELRAEFEKSEDHLVKGMPFDYYLQYVFPLGNAETGRSYSIELWNRRVTLAINKIEKKHYTAIIDGEKLIDKVHTYGILNRLILDSLSRERVKEIIPQRCDYFIYDPLHFNSNQDFLNTFLQN